MFVRRYSIDTPSLLHRWSIVSMEDRWTIDGELMEDERYFCDIITSQLLRKGKEKECEIQNELHTLYFIRQRLISFAVLLYTIYFTLYPILQHSL